ncbi:MAG TPA: hypothetical protein DDZ39_10535 [Flavobacteriaceae bacterium]|jgi:hypothetical protein|nr:hypothetical protein [Flavobacteriaceae bacterium]
MKNSILLMIFMVFMFAHSGQSQSMTNDKLEKIIYVIADSLRGNTGNWQFMIKERMLVCVTDEKNNRMRIMSPIIEQKKLAYVDMLKLMEANFHTALDVKYAISDDLLWSVYIHPLKELTKEELLSAINQVYAAAITYGTSYSSTGLTFPNKKEEGKAVKRKI